MAQAVTELVIFETVLLINSQDGYPKAPPVRC